MALGLEGLQEFRAHYFKVYETIGELNSEKAQVDTELESVKRAFQLRAEKMVSLGAPKIVRDAFERSAALAFDGSERLIIRQKQSILRTSTLGRAIVSQILSVATVQ